MAPDGSDRASAALGRTIPALPVRDMEAAVTYYRERFGFNAPHETEDFAVLTRDDAVIHLWAARDDDWHAREDLTDRPICSGAESFLAGTASCRIEVRDVDALLGELKREACCTRSRNPVSTLAVVTATSRRHVVLHARPGVKGGCSAPISGRCLAAL